MCGYCMSIILTIIDKFVKNIQKSINNGHRYSFKIHIVTELQPNITYLHFSFKFIKNFNYMFPLNPHNSFTGYAGLAFQAHFTAEKTEKLTCL